MQYANVKCLLGQVIGLAVLNPDHPQIHLMLRCREAYLKFNENLSEISIE